MQHDVHAQLAQPLDLPGLGIEGHVNGGPEAEGTRGNAHTEPKISGATNRDHVAREERSRLGSGQLGDVVPVREQPVPPREVFGEHEDLVDPAACLDRARDRQGIVGLDEHAAEFGTGVAKRRAQGLGLDQVGADLTSGWAKVGEGGKKKRCKALPVGDGLLHLGRSDR